MFNKKSVFSQIIIGVALIIALTAIHGRAALITVSPEFEYTDIGSMVRIDIMVSELGSTEDVGAFDVSVGFDAGIMEFVSSSISDNLGCVSGGDAIDVSTGEITSGIVNISGLSLLPDLFTQPERFSLGSIVFKGKAFGTSELTLTSSSIVVHQGTAGERTYTNMLGDAFGERIDFTLGDPASVQVPEASTFALMFTGLTGLSIVGMWRRKS
jgi:hypothetical protein